MYVLLMLVLATLVVWFVVYNILSYWLKKKGILQDELGNQRHDVITVVDRIEEQKLKVKNLEAIEDASGLKVENLEAEKEEAEIEAENLEPEEEEAEIEENLELEEERAEKEAENLKSEEEVAKKKINSLIILLESRNVKYKDDRNKGGGFWIFGEGDLSHVILDANKLGLRFYNNNNRWYLDNKKVLVKKRANKRTEARDSIMILLDGSGIKYVDRRNNKNGKLWIIGGNELKDFAEYAKQFKIYFKFQPEGDADTKHKPGWWIK